jgi:hypothetical protein
VPTRTHLRLGYFAIAIVSFALGAAAVRWWPTQDPPPPGAPADEAGVRLVLDAGGIELLPDASLRLDLPRGFDAAPPE